MIYPKCNWPVIPKHWFRIYRYKCGKCGWESRVMKLTANQHYYRCQLNMSWHPLDNSVTVP